MRGIVRILAAIAVSTTIAGTCLAGPASPVEVAIGPPTGIATDAVGNVYFSSRSIVYRLDPAGTLTRFAGNGTAGYSGDGGPATAAQLDLPFDNYAELAHDFIDFNPLVGALAVDAAGNLFIADVYNNRIRRVDAAGVISTVAGGGPAGYPHPSFGNAFGWPAGVAFGTNGSLYVAGGFGTLVRISRDGTVTSLATSNCGGGFRGPGLCAPEQIAVDASGNVFVPDTYCRVRKVSPDGSVATVAGNETPDNRNFVVTCGYSGDGGPALGAALSNPFAVALDGEGNLYIADTYNHCVRKVDRAGVITTFAGTCGRAGLGGDGGAATAAQLWEPFGVATDANGNVYIADTLNYRIRKVASDGRISTIAGNGGSVPEIDLPAPAGAIGPGVTGSWYDPTQNGQGFMLEVLPGSPQRLLVSWLTFTPSGGPAWVAGVGGIEGNHATLTGLIMEGSGGRFPPNFDATNVHADPWGTLTFTFTDCSHGHVDWTATAPGYGNGGMDLLRLTLPAGLTCP